MIVMHLAVSTSGTVILQSVVLLKVTRIINASPLLFMPPKLTAEQKAIRDLEKKQYMLEYDQARATEKREYAKQWRADNPERCDEQAAERREKEGPYSTWPEWKKERHRKYTRTFRSENPEKVQLGKDKTNARRRELYRTDEAYREARKAESRLIMPEIQRMRRARLKAEVFDHYGKTCACCGETEINFLTIGHVNGDGAEHRRKLYRTEGREGGNTCRLYLDLIRRGFPDDVRIECYNCNCGSFRNGGVCPHERDRLIKVAPLTDVPTDLLPCAPEAPTTASGQVN